MEWGLNNMLLNKPMSQQIKTIAKNTEMNENENTTFQNPWDEAKAILRGKFITI